MFQVTALFDDDQEMVIGPLWEDHEYAKSYAQGYLKNNRENSRFVKPGNGFRAIRARIKEVKDECCGT